VQRTRLRRAPAGAVFGQRYVACQVGWTARPAADARVGREGEEAEKAVVKPQAAGESEHAAKREQKARSPAGKGKAD